MVTTEVDPDDASRYGVVQTADGRVTDYAYKPDEPASDLVTNEVFVFTPGPVLDLLDELGAAAGEDGLEDLGDELLPRLVQSGRAREHRFEGYWRDLGTIDAYWSAHMDLLEEEPPFDPGDDDWRLITRGGNRPPAAIIQSGWARARSESGLIISGSTHSPNSMPSPRTTAMSGPRPSGQTSGETTQSPSPEVSSRREENQPSSST